MDMTKARLAWIELYDTLGPDLPRPDPASG
jgi:hypothetical protein